MRATTDDPRPLSHRLLPFRRRGDLVVREAVYCGQPCWILKDPVSLEYFRIDELQWHVLRLLVGTCTLRDLRQSIEQQHPSLNVTSAELLQLLADLHHRRLLLSDLPGQADVLLEDARQEAEQSRLRAIRSIFFICLPGMNPEPLLKVMHAWVGWIFSPVFVLLCSLCMLAVGLHAAANFDMIEQGLPQFEQFFGWPNVLMLWITMGLTKVVHEIGHGLACRRFGGECHSIGAAFLMFSPCLYCDVSDAWLLPERKKRIAVSLAGMYVETLISAAALVMWHNLSEGLLRNLCFNVFLVTSITTIAFNANPLLRYDGYYILSDFLEMPNLRQKASRVVGSVAAQLCLGVPPHPQRLPNERLLLVGVYGVASLLYGWFVVGAILLILHDRLKPYGLENQGTAVGVLLIVSAVTGLLWRAVRCFAVAEKRHMNLRRPLTTGLVLTALGWVLLRVPLPYSIYAPVLVEPARLEPVHTRTAGRLEHILVSPGEYVQQGQLLAVLSNPHKQEHFTELQTARRLQQIEVALQRGLNDSREEAIAITRMASMGEQLQDYHRQLQDLRVTAPSDGVVVQSPDQPAGPEGRENETLGTWNGHPLDLANLGCWLPTGTHLLSTSPGKGWEGRLLIDQRNREFFSPGATVEVRLESCPASTFTARIRELGDQELDHVPPASTVPFGGELPVMSGSSDRTRLLDPVYQATVDFDLTDGVIHPGARGLARLRVSDGTVGSRLWACFRQLTRFRL